MVYGKVLNAAIEREITGIDFICSENDKALLQEMMFALNAKIGTSVQYLAELDALHIFGAGDIVSAHIDRFDSPTIRAFLVPQLVLDKVKDCDQILLRSYLHFKDSPEYISPPGKPSPAHIHARYDAAFRRLKSKRIMGDLLQIVSSPRDAFYLPLTTIQLASRKFAEFQKFLVKYSRPDGISMEDVGLYGDGESFYPPFSFICRELRFIGIDGLKYYPSEESLDALKICIADTDADISSAAKRIASKMSVCL